MTSELDRNRIRKLHQLRSFRIASVLRIGVVALMLIAMLVGTARVEWPKQSVLLALYAFAAVCALILAFSPGLQSVLGTWHQFMFTVIDVAALTGFQLLSTNGYIPLLVMGLLPVLVGLDVSWRRAALVLAFLVVAFAVALLQDPVMSNQLGWPKTGFLLGIYGFLCCTAFVAVRVEQRHANAVAGLTTVREELLTETMTASEAERRRVSESIHDGPLQAVLVVRQELEELATIAPHAHVDRALACLHDASTRLREATVELHPAVLEQVGLSAAVEQLATFTARRSGIAITTDIDYPTRSTADPIVFGVARELLSNVVRHSRASQASVKLAIDDRTCCLEVADNGIGIDSYAAARASAGATSRWPRTAPASKPPEDTSHSSMHPSAPMSASKYRFGADDREGITPHPPGKPQDLPVQRRVYRLPIGRNQIDSALRYGFLGRPKPAKATAGCSCAGRGEPAPRPAPG